MPHIFKSSPLSQHRARAACTPIYSTRVLSLLLDPRLRCVLRSRPHPNAGVQPLLAPVRRRARRGVDDEAVGPGDQISHPPAVLEQQALLQPRRPRRGDVRVRLVEAERAAARAEGGDVVRANKGSLPAHLRAGARGRRVRDGDARCEGGGSGGPCMLPRLFSADERHGGACAPRGGRGGR